jgi:hypothetical protein
VVLEIAGRISTSGTSGSLDGHASPSATCMTCVVPNGGTARGPSIDYVAGLRLRSSSAQKMAIVIPAQAAPFDNSVTQDSNPFLGANGTPATTRTSTRCS